MSEKVTLATVARHAGVPLNQVMKVLLGDRAARLTVPIDVQNRVLDAVKELDYLHITPQKAGAGDSIALFTPAFHGGDYIGHVVRAIHQACDAKNYGLTLNMQNPDIQENVNLVFSDKTIKGVMLLVPEQSQLIAAACKQHQLPYIVIDAQNLAETEQALSVMVDNRQAIINVMEHLLSLGHRRIAFITGRLDVSSAQERLQGYWDALKVANIAYDEALVTGGDWSDDSGYDAAKKLLQHKPTAIVASNDLMAMGALRAIRENGLAVPGDISVTGFDDIPLAANVTPPLTTVGQPMSEIGTTAFDLLYQAMQGKKVKQRSVTLQTKLILRESTGKPKN
jgi:LacI family transcriptional regulator